jgi:GAF domain-containing protein
VEPIPETRELLELLRAGADDDERLDVWLRTRARQVAALIPDCVGITIAMTGELGMTFTFVATTDDLRLVDGAQYLDGGPCEDAVTLDVRVESELFSERRWRLAALAGARSGVRSSLSLPIRVHGKAVGSVNVYGAYPTTFQGHGRALAALFGAAAEEAVSNADLPMTGVERARRSTEQVADEAALDTATGVLAERERLAVEDARQRLEDAAARAGVKAAALAKLILADAEDSNR